MTLSNDNFNQILLIISKYQKQLHLLAVLLLSLYLIAYAAQLTWKLVPVPENTTVTVSNANTSSKQPTGSRDQVNIAALKRLNLFGELGATPVEPKETVTDAPETNLNLVLAGVVASGNPELGAAIIENKGKQATYAVGEDIDGTRAKLAKIYDDRVIIRNGGRDETLMLDGMDYNKSSTKQSKRNSRPQPGPKAERVVQNRLSKESIEARRQLKEKPSQFTDFISIAPFTKAGELQGYRITPGKKGALFKEAGFKSGDVVVDINGLDLRDAQQALEAMSALRESQSLQLTVNRDGEFMTLYLDIPEED